MSTHFKLWFTFVCIIYAFGVQFFFNNVFSRVFDMNTGKLCRQSLIALFDGLKDRLMLFLAQKRPLLVL